MMLLGLQEAPAIAARGRIARKDGRKCERKGFGRKWVPEVRRGRIVERMT